MSTKFKSGLTRFGTPTLIRGYYWLLGTLWFVVSIRMFEDHGIEKFGFIGMVIGLFLFAACMFVLSLPGWGISYLVQRRNQNRRDERARKIVASVRTDQDLEEYSLYLRGFALTGKLSYYSVKSQDDNSTRFNIWETHRDLEDLLAEAVEPIAPLVALGRPGEAFGAGRAIVNDDYWQDDIKALALRCQFVYFLPYNSPGTKWEIDWILNHKLIESVSSLCHLTNFSTLAQGMIGRRYARLLGILAWYCRTTGSRED
jgi:hypothetical protein